MNKRKRVAQQKHRVKERKLEEKRKATRAASTLVPARPRPVAEAERPAPIVPTSRPPAPRRPRTTRPSGATGQPQEQGRGQAQGQRPPARPAPRRPAQSEQPEAAQPQPETKPEQE